MTRAWMSRTAVGAGRALWIVFAGAALAACGDEAATPVASEDVLGIEADNVAFGMSSYMTAQGIREGRVIADTAFFFADSAKAKLHGMTIEFFFPDGRRRATVTGKTGEWDQNTDRMSAWGDVVLVVHEDGRKIESQELHYDPTRDRIWSDSATVQTERGGAVTRGTAFESDMEFKNLRIANIRGGGGRIF